LCCEKRARGRRNGRTKEFPEEPAHDLLDEEATTCVKGMLADKKPEESLAANVGAEQNHGKTEYKLTLFGKEGERIKHLTTQLNFRLNEGKGQAIYRIGIEDNGNPKGIDDTHFIGSLSTSITADRQIETLYKMSRALNTDMMIDKVYNGLSGK